MGRCPASDRDPLRQPRPTLIVRVLLFAGHPKAAMLIQSAQFVLEVTRIPSMCALADGSCSWSVVHQLELRGCKSQSRLHNKGSFYGRGEEEEMAVGRKDNVARGCAGRRQGVVSSILRSRCDSSCGLFFLGFSILFDAAIYLIGGFLLHRFHSRAAAVVIPATGGVLALRNSGEQTGRKSGRGLKHFLVVDRLLGRDPGSRSDIQIEESVCFGSAAR